MNTCPLWCTPSSTVHTMVLTQLHMLRFLQAVAPPFTLPKSHSLHDAWKLMDFKVIHNSINIMFWKHLTHSVNYLQPWYSCIIRSCIYKISSLYHMSSNKTKIEIQEYYFIWQHISLLHSWQAAQHSSLLQSAMSHDLDILLQCTVDSISFLNTISKEENENIFFHLTKISPLGTSKFLK
jgi:hypothetical protein